MTKQLITLLLFFGLITTAWCQPPVNDDCSGAIDMDPFLNDNGTCVLTYSMSYNVDSVTHSAAEGAPSATCTNAASDPTPLDVWFRLTVPALGEFDWTHVVDPGFSSITEAYTGSCGSLTALMPVVCNNSGTRTFTGLTPGTTVYLRTWDFGSNDSGTLEVCATFTSCPSPSGLSSDSISTNFADISWDPSAGSIGYIVEYGETGFTSGSGMTMSTSDTFATLSGLEASTVYQAQVYSICGSDTSAPSARTSFTTLCDVESAPYLEEFTTFTPICWEQAGSGTPNTGPSGLGTSSWVSDEWLNTPGLANGNGVNINLFSSGKEEWILSPIIDLSGGSYELVLDVAVTDWQAAGPDVMGSDDTVQLLINENNTGWQVLETWSLANQPSETGQTEVIDLSSYSSSSNQFAIWAAENTDSPEDYDFHVDNFEVRVPPACPEPTGVSITMVTASSAVVSWGNTGALNYIIEYDTAGFALGTGMTTTSTDTTETLTSLIEQSTYDVYVYSVCEGDTSAPSSQVAFTTPCAPVTPDYLEEFDAFLPDCWEEATDGTPATGPIGLGSGDWTSDGLGNNGASGAARINLFNVGTSDWLISPEVDLQTGGPHEVLFDLAITSFNVTTPSQLGSDDRVELLVSIDGGATWTALMVWDSSSVVPNPQSEVIDLSAYMGEVVTFAFWGSEGTVDDLPDIDFSFDNFQVRETPDCANPSFITANNITLDAADMSWTDNASANAWDLYYGPAPLPAPTGGTVPTESTVMSNTDYTISGLSAGTSYEFYVRADCGGSVSVWTGPFSFSTVSLGQVCDAPIANLTVGVDSCSMATSTTVDFSMLNPIGNQTCDAFGTNYGQWYTFTAPSSGNVDVIINGATSFELAILDACDGTTVFCSSNGTSTETRSVQNLTPSAEYKLVIWRDLQSTSTSFCLVEGDPCLPLTSGTVEDITSSTANVSWNGNILSTGFVIEYDTSGFALGSGTQVNTGTPGGPIELSGLMSATEYQVYIWEICGGAPTDTLGSISFTTDCAIFTAPYTEDFTNFVPQCWDEAGSGDPSTGPQSLGTGEWAVDGFGNNGSTGAARINLWNTGTSDWLLTPVFDLSGGNHSVNFDIALTAFGDTTSGQFGADDKVEFLITNDGGMTWTSLSVWDSSAVISNTGDSVNIDLSAYTGDTVQFAFWGSEETVDDPTDLNFYVDNFELALSDDPCGDLSISGTPAAGTYHGTTITSDAMIASPNAVIFKAQNEIDLTPEFEVEQGATFDALIEDCP